MTQLRNGLRWGLGMLVVVGLLGIAGAARGQAGASTPVPRTVGTSETAHVIGASEFDPEFSGLTYGYVLNSKFSSGVSMVASVRLPSGAVVTRVELEACDFSTVQRVVIGMSSQSLGSTSDVFLVTELGTGNLEAPGCVSVSKATLPQVSPVVIDNENRTYRIKASAPSASARLTAVRVYYTLQVSPAPAVATFSDVPPSHDFFRFIEALARSGITAGCGGGNFCPDAPLTRGQMAVFLSLGLGLHFAP
jgi:S-layer family protein